MCRIVEMAKPLYKPFLFTLKAITYQHNWRAEGRPPKRPLRSSIGPGTSVVIFQSSNQFQVAPHCNHNLIWEIEYQTMLYFRKKWVFSNTSLHCLCCACSWSLWRRSSFSSVLCYDWQLLGEAKTSTNRSVSHFCQLALQLVSRVGGIRYFCRLKSNSSRDFFLPQRIDSNLIRSCETNLQKARWCWKKDHPFKK